MSSAVSNNTERIHFLLGEPGIKNICNFGAKKKNQKQEVSDKVKALFRWKCYRILKDLLIKEWSRNVTKNCMSFFC